MNSEPRDEIASASPAADRQAESPSASPAPEVAASEAAPGAEAAAGGEGDAPPGQRRERSRNRRRGKRGQSSAAPGVAPEPPPPLDPAQATELFAAVTSGDFDIEPPAETALEGEAEAEAAKRVLPPEPEAPKLHKVLAQSGIGSRRDMEQLIADGRVSVNGEPAHVGQRISYGDKIEVGGKPVKVRISPGPARVIAYHKPAGEVVSFNDPEQRPTVFRNLPRLAHGKWQSVGRLDINTEGLLLFTTSGDLANRLMHPRFGVEREYAVRVLGTVDDEAREKLLAGVPVDGQPAAFQSIVDGGGDGANRWYRVVITEGRNREVRKLFEAVGLAVSRLIRIRYGCVVLPRGLRRGVCVDLSEADVRSLRMLTGSTEGQQRGAPPERAPKQEKQPSNRRDNRRDRPPRGPEGPQQAGGEAAAARQRGPRPPRQSDPNREPGDPGTIPNPLQQTYDKRPLQRERPLHVADEGDDDGPIPNPLQQTYDRRFVQKPSSRGGSQGRGGSKGGGNAPRQPDPMQTSVGYIGADAFLRKSRGSGGGGRRGGR